MSRSLSFSPFSVAGKAETPLSLFHSLVDSDLLRLCLYSVLSLSLSPSLPILYATVSVGARKVESRNKFAKRGRSASQALQNGNETFFFFFFSLSRFSFTFFTFGTRVEDKHSKAANAR